MCVCAGVCKNVQTLVKLVLFLGLFFLDLAGVTPQRWPPLEVYRPWRSDLSVKYTVTMETTQFQASARGLQQNKEPELRLLLSQAPHPRVRQKVSETTELCKAADVWIITRCHNEAFLSL